MKRTLFAGALALGIAALVNPALAQGDSGVKSDSTAGNPSTKTGGPAANKDNMKGTAGSTTGAAPRSESSQGSGANTTEGPSTKPMQPSTDPRANPTR